MLKLSTFCIFIVENGKNGMSKIKLIKQNFVLLKFKVKNYDFRASSLVFFNQISYL